MSYFPFNIDFPSLPSGGSSCWRNEGGVSVFVWTSACAVADRTSKGMLATHDYMQEASYEVTKCTRLSSILLHLSTQDSAAAMSNTRKDGGQSSTGISYSPEDAPSTNSNDLADSPSRGSSAQHSSVVKGQTSLGGNGSHIDRLDLGPEPDKATAFEAPFCRTPLFSEDYFYQPSLSFLEPDASASSSSTSNNSLPFPFLTDAEISDSIDRLPGPPNHTPHLVDSAAVPSLDTTPSSSLPMTPEREAVFGQSGPDCLAADAPESSNASAAEKSKAALDQLLAAVLANGPSSEAEPATKDELVGASSSSNTSSTLPPTVVEEQVVFSNAGLQLNHVHAPELTLAVPTFAGAPPVPSSTGPQRRQKETGAARASKQKVAGRGQGSQSTTPGGSQDDIWVCPVPNCLSTFHKSRGKQAIDRHKNTHYPDKVWVCPCCGVGISRSDSLDRHWMRRRAVECKLFIEAFQERVCADNWQRLAEAYARAGRYEDALKTQYEGSSQSGESLSTPEIVRLLWAERYGDLHWSVLD